MKVTSIWTCCWIYCRTLGWWSDFGDFKRHTIKECVRMLELQTSHNTWDVIDTWECNDWPSASGSNPTVGRWSEMCTHKGWEKGCPINRDNNSKIRMTDEVIIVYHHPIGEEAVQPKGMNCLSLAWNIPTMPSHAKPPNPLTRFFIVSSIRSSHLMCWLSPASIPLCYAFSIVSMMKFSTSSSFAAPDLVAMAYDLPGCLRVMLQCVFEGRNLWFWTIRKGFWDSDHYLVGGLEHDFYFPQ